VEIVQPIINTVTVQEIITVEQEERCRAMGNFRLPANFSISVTVQEIITGEQEERCRAMGNFRLPANFSIIWLTLISGLE
jgi:hypothetical protein